MTASQGTAGDWPTSEHIRPSGVSDATVEALGKVSEALETVERARGHLYSFHQLTGSADLSLDEAVTSLHEAGHHDWADRIRRELIGRNVVEGRWTFQIVEDYDDGYYDQFHQLEKALRDELAGGRRHLFEAEMKEDRRTHGHPAHTSTPPVEEPAR
jgi:hypothetical protein